VHFLRLSVWYGVARSVALSVLCLVALCCICALGGIFGGGSAGAATPAWVSQSGGDEWVCYYDTDDSCGTPGSGTAVVAGPATLTLPSNDQTSGEDIELSMYGASGPPSSCLSDATLFTADYVASAGYGYTTCSLVAGDSVNVALQDYGPYSEGGVDGVSPFTPAASPDADYAVFSGGGGGGMSSALVSSDFASSQSTLLVEILLGVGLLVTLIVVALAIRLLVKYSRRAVRAA
jgi:hypothetical protein